MEPISLAVGAVIALAGTAVGRFLPVRRKPAAQPDPPPQCSCRHPLSDHERESGVCNGKRLVVTYRDHRGIARDWTEAACTCQQYVGPQPIDHYYAPEITG